MKYSLFFILVCLTLGANAQQQSLKDALYSGKLRLDTGTVIKKGDDLTARMDSVKRKPMEVEKPASAGIVRDTVTGNFISKDVIAVDSPKVVEVAADGGLPEFNNMKVDSSGKTGNVEPVAAEPVVAGPATNNKIWKDYITEFTTTLRSEVMSSKKIKGGTYSVLIDYEIGLDGQVAVTNVQSSPANSFLEGEVKNRMTLTAPQLAPLLNSFGKPRKAPKKQTIVLNK